MWGNVKNPAMILKTNKFEVPKVGLYKLKQKSLNFWGNRNWFNMARVPYIRTFILSPRGGGGGGELAYEAIRDVAFFRVSFFSPNS